MDQRVKHSDKFSQKSQNPMLAREGTSGEHSEVHIRTINLLT